MESAVCIAESVAAGAAKPGDVFAEHVARHRETAAALNALVQSRHAAAGAEVTSLENAMHDPGTRGPLAGVPVSVKECFPVAGLVTTLGITARRRAVDPADAALVTRLRAAGAVVVGKANVPQALFLHETDNPVWGRTNHPEKPERGPGGSSGGDAALVAAGVVPLAVGTDLAGSVRQPAHSCGIAGFLPRSTVIGHGGSFDTMPHVAAVRVRAGFLARHVDDLSLAFRATCGDASGGPVPSLAGAGLRVAWWDDAGPIEPSPAVRRAVQEAVAVLERAGVEVVRFDGSLAAEAAWLHFAILSADGGADVRRLFAGTRPIPPVARLLALAGVPTWLRPVLASASRALGGRIEADGLLATGPRRGAALEQLLAARRDLADRFAAACGGFAAVVCPVSALPALRHGSAARLVVAAAPCLLASLLDLPAGTVPVTRVRPEEQGRGWSRDRVVQAAAAADRDSRGLPVGVQVVGCPGSGRVADPHGPERVVLDVMRLIERGIR